MKHFHTSQFFSKKQLLGSAFAWLLCLVGFFAFGQKISPSVLSAGGGRISTHDMTLDWTLGETLVGDFSIGQKRFTEGFHQPFLKVEIAETAAVAASDRSNSGVEKAAFSMTCWPNPATEMISARIDSKEWATAMVLLMTGDGQTLQKIEQPTNVDFEISLNSSPNGLYFLHFFSPKGQPLGSRKVTIIR